ncbi:NHLP family bacteriocin export ABC transporter peptidase/permease/ATPase subunit [Streptomyces sp. Ag109_O5-1]|uniref:NHLP family bacteriocin export ABC transporter peptidase/permease/ATPase subunit n=1 Tax=Streptomyces sp. Ag109_O5-1 TaxID=1938851 RepID=UPI0026B0B1C3
MESTECGAASLSMVLAHFGRHVPLEELRKACGVSRDGAMASALLAVARQYGLQARGANFSAEAQHTMPAPSILFWEFNHYVVFEGFGRRRGRTVVYLNDPARGHRRLSLAEFDESFTGIALTMSPGKDFTPGGRVPGRLSGLPTRLAGIGMLLVAGMVAELALAVVGFSGPAFSRAFVDTILLGGDRSIIVPYFVMMVATTAVVGLLTGLLQGFLLRARIVGSTLNTTRFLRHVLRLPADFFSQRSVADIAQRVQSNDDVSAILSTQVSNVGVYAVMILGYGALLWTYNAMLTALSIGLALLNVGALRLAAVSRRVGVANAANDEAELLTTSYNIVHSIETIKAVGSESEYFRRWAAEQAKVVSGRQRIGTPLALLAVVAPTLAALNGTLVLLLGGLQAVHGQISIGSLIAFSAFVVAFTLPITRLTGIAGQAQDIAVKMARLHDVERYPISEKASAPARLPARQLIGELEFDQVTFGYSRPGDPLLRDFSFAVGPGRQVALVGGSGSGKSTVARLIAGQYVPWTGEIRLDGRPREEIPPYLLAGSMTFVDQDIFLYDGSVRDNITLWDDAIPDEDVVAALKDAAVYDVVAARAGGIHSRVEEDGRNFSGGQRQRLEIARALVRDPAVLVLDEATSALDAETEKKIIDNVRRRGCACVVIAHRLSTVRDSDEIVVLQRGAVVERGVHDDLVAAGGPYALLMAEH